MPSSLWRLTGTCRIGFGPSSPVFRLKAGGFATGYVASVQLFHITVVQPSSGWLFVSYSILKASPGQYHLWILKEVQLQYFELFWQSRKFHLNWKKAE